MNKPFTRVTVSPNFAIGHLIQWKLDNSFAEAEPYNFIVEVSGAPDFSDVAYELPAGDMYFVVEAPGFKQAFEVDLYYRVKLTTGDNKVFYSQVIVFGATVENRRNYKLASEISRKELLRSRKYTGFGTYLLKRKTFGEVRQDAVDPISGAPITDNVSDFGTGLNGGYYSPVKIITSYEQGKQTRTLSEAGLGLNESFIVKMRMIGYPYVETQDIIVDGDTDERFIVKEVESIFFPGTSIVLIQTLTAGFVPYTDPIYKIQVK